MNAEHPIITLQVEQEGKKAVAVNLDNRLLSLTYEDDERKADKLTLELDNYDWEMLDGVLFKKGNILTAGWGYAGNMQTTSCIVKRLSGDFMGKMTVEAVHTGFLLHQNTKSRTFENMTRSEVAGKIATENGYSAAAQDIEDTKLRHPIIGQASSTDAAFIKRLAGKEGFQFWIDSSGFHFHRRRKDQAPIKKLRWFTDQVGEVVDGTWESESKKKKGKTGTKGRDPFKKEDISVEAKASTVPNPCLAAIAEITDGQTGIGTFQSRMVDDHVQPTSEATAAAAKASAHGAFQSHHDGQFKVTITCVGDPKLRAKCVVELTGIGKRYSGLWYVKKATHHLEETYTTKLEIVRDGHNGHKGVSTDAKTGTNVNTKAVDDGPRVAQPVNEVTGEDHYEWRTK